MQRDRVLPVSGPWTDDRTAAIAAVVLFVFLAALSGAAASSLLVGDEPFVAGTTAHAHAHGLGATKAG